MCFDGFRGDAKSLGNFIVAVPKTEQSDNLLFPMRKRCPALLHFILGQVLVQSHLCEFCHDFLFGAALLYGYSGSVYLADIADCPSLGATAKQPQPNPLLDNIEGMAITGREPGGRLKVLLVSDDNQNQVQTTRFYSLRVRLPFVAEG